MNETEKWEMRVKQFCESGKSQRAWCREQGFKRSTLRYWLERTDEITEGGEIRFAKIITGGELSDKYQFF